MTSTSRPQDPWTFREPFQLEQLEDQTVRQLLGNPHLADAFTTQLVFVHDKRDLADRILTTAQRALPGATFHLLDVSSPSWSPPSGRVRRQTVGRRHVAIYRSTGNRTESAHVVSTYASAQGRRGLWFLGQPSDVPPHLLSMFRIVFLFDMPAREMASVRSAMTLPAQAWSQLRANAATRTEVPLVSIRGVLLNGRVVTLRDNPRGLILD